MGFEKKGQITVFMILGLALLFSAIFLFYLVSLMSSSSLESSKEDILSAVFEKESLNIFVQDCLQDSLEEGLILIGEQGRLWDGQSGGQLNFIEGENGITSYGFGASAKQIYLAIINEENFEYPNSYPCKENESAPDFCRYELEESGKFGSKEAITRSSIENDLERFMQEETVVCVEEFLSSELSYSGEIQSGELELDLSIQLGGIEISVEYPLELIIGEERYFHLQNFDFFYQSNFRTFLTQGLTLPLGNEQKDISYNFEENSFLDSISYSYFSTDLYTLETGSGDTIYQYDLASGSVLKNKDYSFSFAIENRPPALDYVSKKACGEYDYLVLKGYYSDMGGINISTIARDPDEDNISFSYDSSGQGVFSSLIYEEENTLFVESEDYSGNESLYGSNLILDYNDLNLVSNFEAGIYEILINATDAHGLSDWQTVRVLIDRDMSVDVEVSTGYDKKYKNGKLLVSSEDPIFIEVKVPEESLSSFNSETVTLDYTDNLGLEEWFGDGLSFDLSNYRENCFSFPFPNENLNCDLSDYENSILDWTEKRDAIIFDSEGQIVSDSIDTAFASFWSQTSDGELNLDFSSSYCAEYQQESSDDFNFYVAGCYPLENEEHPYAYPYHEYTVDSSGNYVGETEINPFLATHSCCDTSSYEFLEEGTLCYESEPGCYGKIVGHSYGKEGYVLEVARDYCSGERGNVCGKGDGSSEYDFYQGSLGKMVCGNYDDLSCDSEKIDENCQNVNAWGFADSSISGLGWCHGDMGCSDFCTKEVVYTGEGDPTVLYDDKLDINKEGYTQKAVNDEIEGTSFSFSCGCDKNTIDNYCDSNFDGRFDGVCQGDTNTGYFCR